jgi:hypothetical protein
MSRPDIRKAAVILALAMSFVAPRASHAQAVERTPVATTPQFVFYSDFETNLNDALIAAGAARKANKPELFHSGDEAAAFGALPEPVRAAWDGAVDYYAKVISPGDAGSDAQYLVRVQIAGFDEQLKEAGERQFVDIARHFRAAAAPAYNTCRWPAQDAKNRRWIEQLKPRLADDEQKIASRLMQLYGRGWSSLPIPVDIVETVDWSGANTIFRRPDGGHLLISNSNPDRNALEIVFHEASHLLMSRNDPIRQALDNAAKAANFRMPGELWHVVLFYTTGEVVRRTLRDSGERSYTPVVYELFDKGIWSRYRKPLETTWLPYIDGKRTLAESATRLIDALNAEKPKPKQ